MHAMCRRPWLKSVRECEQSTRGPTMTREEMAEVLVRRNPAEYCGDCGNEADTAPREQVWYQFNERWYCPTCADRLGIID
jgi:hypothetical protein